MNVSKEIVGSKEYNNIKQTPQKSPLRVSAKPKWEEAMGYFAMPLKDIQRKQDISFGAKGIIGRKASFFLNLYPTGLTEMNALYITLTK
ncbi:MAG: hypothetical protein AAGI66_08575 [Cyanobacteria bacterium P01_H01_bin.74]